MYDHLKPVLKRHPEFLILHIGTNGTSKYIPNEIVDKVLALKRFVGSQNKECKVIISTLTMRVDAGNTVQKVNEILKELNIPLVKNFDIVKKHLGTCFFLSVRKKKYFFPKKLVFEHRNLNFRQISIKIWEKVHIYSMRGEKK